MPVIYCDLKMKKQIFILAILLLSMISCEKNNEETYINLSESEILAPSEGLNKSIHISTNSKLDISEMPDWCQLLVSGNSDSSNISGELTLHVIVRRNLTYQPREGQIRLKIESKIQDIIVKQEAVSKDTTFNWVTFHVNNFQTVTFDKINNNQRIYLFPSEEHFVNPSFVNNVFPGNIVAEKQTSVTELFDYQHYHYNPVTIGAFVRSKAYIETLDKPSKIGLDKLTDSIIRSNPSQSESFYYSSSPALYYSHRQLHLWGMGNLGLELDKLIAGESYSTKEMAKAVGLIYSYNQKLFSIILDNPEKLTQEELGDPGLCFINQISYGKTAFLIVESDYDAAIVNAIVKKKLNGEPLDLSQAPIASQLKVYYLYFTRQGAQLVSGNENVISEYVSGMSKNEILPLSFTVNKCADFSRGILKYEFTLQ